MNASKAAASTKTRLAASLASRTTIVAEARADARVSLERRLAKGGRRRRMVIGRIGGNTVGLAIHVALAVGAKSSLTISGIVLVVVGIAVVWVVVTGVLLSMGLGLRALASLLLLRLLRLLLLGLSSRVGGAVAAVLGITSTSSKSGLVMQRATLRVLAEVVGLGGSVATKGSLLGGGAILLALSLLLSTELIIVVVLVSILLRRRIVRRVVARGGAEGAAGLLRLGGLGREVVEGGLRRGGALLAEGIQRLL